MNAEELIKPEQVLLGIHAETKRDVLELLAGHAEKLGIADDADALLADLLHREEEMATGLAGGYAIPHAKSSHVVRPAVLFAELTQEVAWSSYDENVPAKRVFALLIPHEGGSGLHLRLLSKLAVCLIDDEFCHTVESEHDEEALCTYLRERMEDSAE